MPSPDTKPTALSVSTLSRLSIPLHFQPTKAMSDKERPLWMDPTPSFPPHYQWSTQWVTTNINPLTVPGISYEVQGEVLPVWLYSSIGPCTKSYLKSHFSLFMHKVLLEIPFVTFHAQSPACNPTFHAQSPAWNPTFHAIYRPANLSKWLFLNCQNLSSIHLEGTGSDSIYSGAWKHLPIHNIKIMIIAVQ